MNASRIVIILMIVSLGMTACSAIPSPTTEVAVNLTSTPSPTAAPTATWTPAPTFTPTPSPEPTSTSTRVPTITPTPSPTPIPVPLVTVSQAITTSINVRSGPGVAYPVISQFKPGQTAEVTGRNPEANWWQVNLTHTETYTQGWIYRELVTFSGGEEAVAVAAVPPLPPTPTPPAAVSENKDDKVPTSAELADQLRCGQDFCVTYQAMVPIWENGGCVGNHSIYITVLQGLPPGEPLDGVIVGDTYNNVEVASGDHGPGHTEITLWSNSMTLIVKRNMDGTPYTSQESFNFTARDELIPADVLAASGYCEGNVEKCEYDRNHNSVCRGHYSWRVTFHKLD